MRRLALQDDRDWVYAVYMHPAVIPYLGHDAMPMDAFRAVYDELLSSGHFFVYEHQHARVGFYRVLHHTGRARHVAMLSTLALDPAHHGRGLARVMLDDAIQRLQADGVRRVELTVEADNPRAIAFYQGLGFEQEGVMRAAYRRDGDDHDIDEIVMARLLA